MDEVLGMQTRFGLGFMLPGGVAYMGPAQGAAVGFGYAMNQMSEAGESRSQPLIDTLYESAQTEEDAPALHHRFLDKRSPLPLHGSWADWLWRRGLDNGEIVPLQSVGVSAYRCSPKAGKLREDLSGAVASGWLTLPREEGETDG